MKILWIRPKLDYKLLGTSLRLDKSKVYPAVQARNIEGWKERGLIFVEDSILLENEEYEIVKNHKPTTNDGL